MNKETIKHMSEILPGVDSLRLKQAFNLAKIKVAQRFEVQKVTNADVKKIMQLTNDTSIMTKIFTGVKSEITLKAVLQFIMFADPELLPDEAIEWARKNEIIMNPAQIKQTMNLNTLAA